MKSFEIQVGQSQRLLKFEPQEKVNTFKIYAVDRAEDWIDYEQSRSVDLPGMAYSALLLCTVNIILTLKGQAL